MKLTAAEKEHIKRERQRIELDSRNWSQEPFVTQVQLREMSPHTQDQFSDKIWRHDCRFDVLRNTAHPDNADWVNRERLVEALLAKGDYTSSTSTP